jgi:hypothetical protein
MRPLQTRAAGGGTRELWAWRRGEGIHTAEDSREGSFDSDVVLLSIHMGDSGGSDRSDTTYPASTSSLEHERTEEVWQPAGNDDDSRPSISSDAGSSHPSTTTPTPLGP